MNATKVKPYLDAYRGTELKKDYDNWMLGLYIKSSIASAMDRHNKYPDRPYLQDIEDKRIVDGSNLSEEEKALERKRMMIADGYPKELMGAV